jgi:hypothetical protein
MTTPEATQVAQPSEKEMNFRKLEAYYEQKLAQERAEKEEALRLAREASQSSQSREEEEEDDSDSYVNRKKLDKRLQKFGQSTQSEINKAMETAKIKAKEELKQELWLEQNPDFYDTLQLADKLAENNPTLAQTILRMPDGFARQQLVYQNIKALGLHKPKEEKPSVNALLEKNKNYAGYQPHGFAGPAYATNGDFSEGGKKQAYEKMLQLKKSMRI